MTKNRVEKQQRRGRRRSEVEEPGGPAVVLLAEDDHDMRELIARALRRTGYDVVEARDGSELLELLGNSRLRSKATVPDLIISDVRMPKWSGLEVLAGLRDSDWATPVILITAFGDLPLHQESERLGAVTMLDKPFDVDHLVQIASDIVPPDPVSSAGR